MDHRDLHDDDDSEDITEWLQIEQQPWDMLVVNENYLQAHVDRSSSTEDPPTPTPTHHQEGSLGTVPITKTAEDEEGGTSLSSAESAASVTGEIPPPPPPPPDWRVRVANEGRKLLKLRFEAVRNGVVLAASRVRECAVCVGAFWSVTCVAGAAAAAVLVAVVYVRIRRQRRRRIRSEPSVDHLVHLLRDKDEKISQLLLQIAQLNEVLASRRKVPVLRISSS